MITKVYDVQGNLIHDCEEIRCDASWDGYDMATGEALAGRSDPDPVFWRVEENSAYAK